LHPLITAAAIAVIALCAVGVAAMTGLLPRLSAQSVPEEPPAPAVAAAPADTHTPAAAAGPASKPAPAQPAAARPADPRPASACAECGTVESVREVKVPVGSQGPNVIGAVAGGVVGGVVGNQFGGGHGRDALTVLGAVGGALAGHEIERNIRGQQTVTRYEMSVRMADGSLRTFHSEAPFALASGDHVKVENGRVVLLR